VTSRREAFWSYGIERHLAGKWNSIDKHTRVSQDLSGDTFRFARHLGAIRNDSVSCVGRSAMPTYWYESDGTNFVFTLTTEIIARSAELPQAQFLFSLSTLRPPEVALSTREHADHTFQSGSSPRLPSFVSHNADILDRMRARAGRPSLTE
jgi:hypothetical protein